MVKRHLSLTLEEDIHRQVKNTIPAGHVSPLVNKLLKNYLKQQKKERLIAGYKSAAKSKMVREEDKIWEGSIEDGIDE